MGGRQVCKRGDWLVNNNGDKYTVEQNRLLDVRVRQPGVYKIDANLGRGRRQAWKN
jgi:hypothetical protein